ncbi:MAG TPA: DUF5615 family PIN-like protein [Longimicrobiales bacterium]|nr:DUF5615 family PIN-like protein [Longimicrobiales bacterium]
MRYLLDEDVNPGTAPAARVPGLDVVSVHELNRCGIDFPDDVQLRYAASQARILVTGNRDDFVRLTREFFQTGEPHCGVLIIPYTLPNKQPGRIAQALKKWHDLCPPGADPEPYLIDFLKA